MIVETVLGIVVMGIAFGMYGSLNMGTGPSYTAEERRAQQERELRLWRSNSRRSALSGIKEAWSNLPRNILRHMDHNSRGTELGGLIHSIRKEKVQAAWGHRNKVWELHKRDLIDKLGLGDMSIRQVERLTRIKERNF